MNTFNLLTNKPYYAIACPIEFLSRRKNYIIITSLSDEEERAIDNSNNDITITRGDKTFTISQNEIYVYGQANFSRDSEDLERIRMFNWLPNRGKGFTIPANYDYENHCCYSDKKFRTQYDTFDNAEIVKYCHAVIGKPEKLIIFKQNNL